MKTSELTGAALDRAVHEALGAESLKCGNTAPKYSADWAQAGPLIERESIQLTPDESHNMWCAFMNNEGVGYEYWGPTPLIAAMRCYVASREV
jgi:hypothetical protein